ncbi:hypothetical protein AAC387_Pa08g2469 [Persea americana]
MQKIFSELLVSIYFPERLYDDRILVSCNGLFFSCYYFYFDHGPWLRINLVNQCFISNPWTKERVCIPGPTKPCRFSLWGLAFENNSSHNNDNLASYKIVMAHRIYTFEKKSPYKFEMYSSDKKKWQWLPEAPRPKHHSYCKSDQIAVYCNRVLYWQCRWKKEHALMLNVETESFGHLDLPGAEDNDDDEKEEEIVLCSRLTECNGQLHFIRIGSAYGRLIIWKMTMSGGWLILHNVDLRGAVESNLDLFPWYGTKRGRAVDSNLVFSGLLGIIPIGMSCEGDDKVLFQDTYPHKRIVSYDLKKGVFELVFQKELEDWDSVWKFFPYTPTTKFISER